MARLKTIKRTVIRRSHSLRRQRQRGKGEKKGRKKEGKKAERWKHKKCQRITSNFQWIRPVQGITPAGRFLCDDGVGQEYDRFAICARARRTGIQRFSAHSDSRFESRQDRAFSTRDILFVILLDTGVCTGIIARPLCTVRTV